MKSNIEKKEEQNGCDSIQRRQVRTIPLPKDIEHCRGCPYPRVGFICWDKDGTCLQTDVNRISRPKEE